MPRPPQNSSASIAGAADNAPATANAPTRPQPNPRDPMEGARPPQADVGRGGGAPAGLAVGPPTPPAVRANNAWHEGHEEVEVHNAPCLPPAPVSHHMWTEAELQASGPLLQPLEAADRKLMSAYGDTIHLNDGTHLTSGIDHAEDQRMQCLYRRIVACRLTLWDLPKGRWADRFLQIQTQLFWDVRE